MKCDAIIEEVHLPGGTNNEQRTQPRMGKHDRKTAYHETEILESLGLLLPQQCVYGLI